MSLEQWVARISIPLLMAVLWITGALPAFAGTDDFWQDTGPRTPAFYIDRISETTRSHGILPANSGLSDEASMSLGMTPVWYQATWFRVLCLSLVLLLVWILYRIRVRSISRTISARFDERLDERTRAARELHDTFLQTVQGSRMVADDALANGADSDRMRIALEKLSRWLEQAVVEGRAALEALRVSKTEHNELAESLKKTLQEQSHDSSIARVFSVAGEPAYVHSTIREEVVLIAREAIRNAYLHSRGSQLSVELRYGDNLSVYIKDNGIGIDPKIVKTAEAGYSGMQGMQQRSARMHAKLAISSSRNQGTEVLIGVPGDVAYKPIRHTMRARLMAFFRGRDLRKGP